jgi:hypothetical protein
MSATDTSAAKDIFPTLNLRISISCSSGDKAFPFRFHNCSTPKSLNFSSRGLAPIPSRVRIHHEMGISKLPVPQISTTVHAALLVATFLFGPRDLQAGSLLPFPTVFLAVAIRPHETSPFRAAEV